MSEIKTLKFSQLSFFHKPPKVNEIQSTEFFYKTPKVNKIQILEFQASTPICTPPVEKRKHTCVGPIRKQTAMLKKTQNTCVAK
jgi:hypothetical protein